MNTLVQKYPKSPVSKDLTSSSRRVTLSTTSETPARASFTTPIFEYSID